MLYDIRLRGRAGKSEIAENVVSVKSLLYDIVFLYVYRNNGNLDVSHLNKYNDWDNAMYQDYLKRFVVLHFRYCSYTEGITVERYICVLRVVLCILHTLPNEDNNVLDDKLKCNSIAFFHVYLFYINYGSSLCFAFILCIRSGFLMTK